VNILFTTPVLEHPPAGGPSLRIENTIKALSCETTSLCIVSRVNQAWIGGPVAEAFYAARSNRFGYAPSCRNYSTNRYVRKAQRVIGEFRGSDASQDARYLLECVDNWKIDIVWFGFGNISYPLIRELRSLRSGLKLVCDTDSVWSRFLLRELPYTDNPVRKRFVLQRGRQKEKEERLWVELCNVTTGVSDVDCQYYRSLSANATVFKFSNVIDIDDYDGSPSEEFPDFHRPCILFPGTFGRYNSPSDRAARWILDDVLPRVRQRIPDVHFYIVGAGSDRTLSHRRSNHVTVTGKVQSMLPYLGHSDVVVVPLQFESGTRFKILEAAACRVPIVSTTLGAEGLPLKHEEHLLLANTPQAFADAVCRLITDRPFALQLAGACRRVVVQGFTLENLKREAREILHFLARDTVSGAASQT